MQQSCKEGKALVPIEGIEVGLAGLDGCLDALQAVASLGHVTLQSGEGSQGNAKEPHSMPCDARHL